MWWVGLLTGGPTARGGFGVPLLTTQFQAVASGVAPAVPNSCPRSRAGERGTGRGVNWTSSWDLPFRGWNGSERGIEVTGNG